MTSAEEERKVIIPLRRRSRLQAPVMLAHLLLTGHGPGQTAGGSKYPQLALGDGGATFSDLKR